MIELKPCCNVPFPERLFEEYEVGGDTICANVSTSKALDMMKRFAEMHTDELMFFILQLPRQYKDDITQSKILYDTDEYDVYFIDGLDVSAVCEFVYAVGPFLVKDGMNLFGIGCHKTHEEILFGRYNVMTVYTKRADEYHRFFDEFGIKQSKKLVTAWDTFDEDHPGECRLYTSEETGKTIYDIPEHYKDYGMYLYEVVKEYEKADEKEITHLDLVGRLLLVGITYYTNDDQIVEQKQLYGTVSQASEKGVCIKQKDGSEYWLPGDLSSTNKARPGEYTLRSTGEVVINPDYLATWNVVKGD